MKRLAILVAVLAVFLWVGSATATPVVDGVFGSSEWAGYYADGDGIVSPGSGGQAYDVEYLGLYITSDKVYFGLQTGFDLENGRYWDSLHFAPGDLALDTDNDGTYDHAIRFDLLSDTPSYTLYQVSAWNSVHYNSSNPPNYAYYSDPFTMKSYSKNGAILGCFTPGNDDTGTSWILEGSFDRSLLAAYVGGPMTIHWTMECGNDHLEQTSAPVPEPATMLLFGVGLCGLAFVGRKKLIRHG